jgi:hypothetical protein
MNEPHPQSGQHHEPGHHDHGHHDPGHHDPRHRHVEPAKRQFHKDWRVWLAVVVILVAMAVYVLTNGEVLRPRPVAPASMNTFAQQPFA